MITLHILLAVLALTLSVSALFRRSKNLQKASYNFSGMTLVSGAALALSTPASLPHACVSGGILLLVVLSLGRITTTRRAGVKAVA